jgi:hypothetical protein
MAKIGIKKILPFLAVMIVSGFLSYYLVQTPLHELGHYVFAYSYNKTAVANISLPYEKLLTLDVTVIVHPAVNYNCPMITCYSIPQIFIISFAGYLFELLYLVSLIFIIQILLKRARRKSIIYLTSVFVGFYIIAITILGGWFDFTNPNADLYKIILSSPNIYLGLGIVLAVEILTVVFYIRNLMSLSRKYFNNIALKQSTESLEVSREFH